MKRLITKVLFAKIIFLPQIYLEHPSVLLIILFIWFSLHFGKTNNGHDSFLTLCASGTHEYFLQHSPVGAVSTAMYPIEHIVCWDGHLIVEQLIVESFLHLQSVQTSGCQTSPGKCPW